MTAQRTSRVPCSRQRGAALVEYAFVIIIFFSLIFGITGFGHALYAYHAVNNAAKEGTRWAAVNGSTCSDDGTCDGTNGMNSGPASTSDIVNHVSANLPATLKTANATINANFLAPSGSPPVCSGPVPGDAGTTVPKTVNYPGCTVQVTVTYAYNFVFPWITTGPINMSSTSEMIIAH